MLTGRTPTDLEDQQPSEKVAQSRAICTFRGIVGSAELGTQSQVVWMSHNQAAFCDSVYELNTVNDIGRQRRAIECSPRFFGTHRQLDDHRQAGGTARFKLAHYRAGRTAISFLGDGPTRVSASASCSILAIRLRQAISLRTNRPT